jgi:hypothetical protein
LDRYGNRFGGRSRGLGGGGEQSEMVEKIVRDVGDIVDGRKTWKDLLKGVIADVEAAEGSDPSSRRRRRK